ncbi:MAG TPA: MmgE/PrpD family protein [Xanthobacteraceae bacterium]
MVISPTHALAEFAAALTFDRLPSSVVTNLKLMILDALGCAIAATTLGEGCRETIAVMQNLGGRPESTIIGSGVKVSAPNAAFANGALVHALNYDPIGSDIGHVGVVCLAAPLAMAEAIGGVSGADFLAASAAACEISARITAAIARTGRRPSEKFLSGQLLSYFGAAAGAGRVLGLDATQMQSALGLALMQMSGSRQIVLCGDPPAKAIYGAFPNQGGVLAALLSREGLRADCDVAGEPAGLYPMIYGGDCDVAALSEGLGAQFLLDEVEFKLWPTSNHVHAFIEAASNIPRLEVSAIREVEVVADGKLRPWCEPLDKRRRPDNAAAAANSIPFCVAKSLVHGSVTLGDFTFEGLRDGAALAVAERTVCRFDQPVRGALVKVRTTGGTDHEAAIELPLGHKSRPVSRERLVKKFRDCCRHAAQPMAPESIEQIIATIDNLPELHDVRQLVDFGAS